MRLGERFPRLDLPASAEAVSRSGLVVIQLTGSLAIIKAQMSIVDLQSGRNSGLSVVHTLFDWIQHQQSIEFARTQPASHNRDFLSLNRFMDSIGFSEYGRCKC